MTATPHTEENSSAESPVRPRHIHLGIDGTGAAHCYDTHTESIHVIQPDGTREKRISLARDPTLESVEHYIVEIGERRDWSRLAFGRQAFLDRLAEAVI